MIVPRTRLVIATGAVLLPAGIMIAWKPEFTVQAAALVAGLLLLTALDSLVSSGRLRGLLTRDGSPSTTVVRTP